MTLLPIFSRELLSRSRSRATYWTRFAVALVGILVCLESIANAPMGNPARMGKYVFNAIVLAAFLVSCSVCLLAADAISAERREGTLGLLFLTRVRAIDILLGKLGSVGITSIGALAAFLPVLMIPVLAGGITGGEASRKGLALLNLLFFAMVAGLCASASQRERFQAVRGALLILGLALFVPFLPFAIGAGGLFHLFSALSPLVSLFWASEGHYTSSAKFFWGSLATVQVLAWVLLITAGVRLRHCAGQDSATATFEMPSRIRPERAVGLGSWQPAKADSSPIEWLVFRQYGVSAGIWAIGVLALAYNGWVPLARPPLGVPGTASSWFFAGAFAVVGGLCGGAVVAWVASRFFVSVRRTGELELLLTTPLGVETLVSEQWNVLKRFFVWPVLVMQAPLLPQILAGLTGDGAASGVASTWQSHITLFKALSLANTFLGATALCWLGLWFGSRARTQAGAIVWTVALAKGLPSLVTLFCSVFGAGLLMSTTLLVPSLYAALTWVPELVILIFYVWLIRAVRRRLSSELELAEPISMKFQDFALAAP
jgi:hypothetical protein